MPKEFQRKKAENFWLKEGKRFDDKGFFAFQRNFSAKFRKAESAPEREVSGCRSSQSQFSKGSCPWHGSSCLGGS